MTEEELEELERLAEIELADETWWERIWWELSLTWQLFIAAIPLVVVGCVIAFLLYALRIL